MLCKKCGTMIPDDSVFCENCGARIEDFEEMTETQEETMEETSEAEIPEASEDAGDAFDVAEPEEPEINEPADAGADEPSAEDPEDVSEPEEYAVPDAAGDDELTPDDAPQAKAGQAEPYAPEEEPDAMDALLSELPEEEEEMPAETPETAGFEAEPAAGSDAEEAEAPAEQEAAEPDDAAEGPAAGETHPEPREAVIPEHFGPVLTASSSDSDWWKNFEEMEPKAGARDGARSDEDAEEALETPEWLTPAAAQTAREEAPEEAAETEAEDLASAEEAPEEASSGSSFMNETDEEFFARFETAAEAPEEADAVRGDDVPEEGDGFYGEEPEDDELPEFDWNGGLSDEEDEEPAPLPDELENEYDPDGEASFAEKRKPFSWRAEETQPFSWEQEAEAPANEIADGPEADEIPEEGSYAEHLKDDLKEQFDHIGEQTKAVAEKVETIGPVLMEKTEEVREKAGRFWEKIQHKIGDAVESAKAGLERDEAPEDGQTPSEDDTDLLRESLDEAAGEFAEFDDQLPEHPDPEPETVEFDWNTGEPDLDDENDDLPENFNWNGMGTSEAAEEAAGADAAGETSAAETSAPIEDVSEEFRWTGPDEDQAEEPDPEEDAPEMKWDVPEEEPEEELPVTEDGHVEFNWDLPEEEIAEEEDALPEELQAAEAEDETSEDLSADGAEDEDAAAAEYDAADYDEAAYDEAEEAADAADDDAIAPDEAPEEAEAWDAEEEASDEDADAAADDDASPEPAADVKATDDGASIAEKAAGLFAGVLGSTGLFGRKKADDEGAQIPSPEDAPEHEDTEPAAAEELIGSEAVTEPGKDAETAETDTAALGEDIPAAAEADDAADGDAPTFDEAYDTDEADDMTEADDTAEADDAAGTDAPELSGSAEDEEDRIESPAPESLEEAKDGSEADVEQEPAGTAEAETETEMEKPEGAPDVKQDAPGADAGEAAQPEEASIENFAKWVGSIGKQVHTGTGWAAEAALEKLRSMKKTHNSERGQWTEEEEGELQQTPGFWYRADPETVGSAMEEQREESKDPSEDRVPAWGAGSEADETAGTSDPDGSVPDGVDPRAEDHEEDPGSRIPEDGTDAAGTDAAGTDTAGSDAGDSVQEPARTADLPEESRRSDGVDDEMKLHETILYREGEEPPRISESTAGPGQRVPGMSGTGTSLTKQSGSRISRGRGFRIRVGVIAVLVAAVLVAGFVLADKHEEVQVQKTNYKATMAEADQYVANNDPFTAEEIYLSLIAEFPDKAEPYEKLAQMYIDQEEYEKATQIIQQGIAAAGENSTFTSFLTDIDALTSTDWIRPYIRILEDNRNAIDNYEDSVEASVALCDVSGDKRPELFFFTKEYYGYGKLRIYTCVEGEAREITYDCKNRSTQYQDAFYDNRQNGSGYAVFKLKEPGKFAIYASFLHGGVDAWQTTNIFEVNSMGGCKQSDVFEAKISTSYNQYAENDNDRSEYLQNETPITYDSYMSLFQGMLDGIDQVILYNESDGGDGVVWEKITVDNVLCTSCEDMLDRLEEMDPENEEENED